MEFYEQNTEYGYQYASDAVVPDGTPPSVLVDDVHAFAAHTFVYPARLLDLKPENILFDDREEVLLVDAALLWLKEILR